MLSRSARGELLRSEWLTGLILLGLAVSQRLLWLHTTHAEIESTGEGSRAIDSLVNRGVLGGIFPGVPGPSAHLAPGWPWLVATIVEATGWSRESAGRLGSLVCVGLTAACLPRLAGKLAAPVTAGRLAGLLMAAVPMYTYSEVFDYFTQPAGALVLLLFGLWLPWEQQSPVISYGDMLTWGLALGLTALLEPVIAFTAGLVMCLVISRSSRAGRAGKLVVLGIVTLGVVSPWLLRNHRELGGGVPIRGNLGLEFDLGNQDSADGTAVRSEADDLHPYTNLSAAQRVAEVGELAYSQEVGGRALRWVAEHPEDFCRLSLTRLRLYWLPPGRLLGSGRLSAWPRAILLWSCTAALCWILAGGLQTAREVRQGLAIFCLVPGLPQIITHVEMRYRQSIWAFDLLLLGVALWAVGTRIQSGRKSIGSEIVPDPDANNSSPQNGMV